MSGYNAERRKFLDRLLRETTLTVVGGFSLGFLAGYDSRTNAEEPRASVGASEKDQRLEALLKEGTELRVKAYVENNEALYDSSIAKYEAAVEVDPNNALAHALIGDVLRIQRKDEAAELRVQKALGLDENSAIAHNLMGLMIYKRAKKEKDENRKQDLYKQAENEFRTAIRLDPKSGAPHNNLGLILYFVQNKPEEAEKEYKAAIKLGSEVAGVTLVDDHIISHSNILTVYSYRAEKMQKEGHNKEALRNWRLYIDTYEKILELGNFPEGHPKRKGAEYMIPRTKKIIEKLESR